MTEELRSRQSAPIRFLRELARDAEARRENGLYLCDGEKLLQEALRSNAEICHVAWREKRTDGYGAFEKEYLLPAELFDYVSPLKNSPGPLFSVRMNPEPAPAAPRRVLVLEEIQDPGNVGTILRTADAFSMDAVILLEGCADVYAPKTVRASMGAVFRQNVLRMSMAEAVSYCRAQDLPLYGAALSPRARGPERRTAGPVRWGTDHPHERGGGIPERGDCRGDCHVGDVPSGGIAGWKTSDTGFGFQN